MAVILKYEIEGGDYYELYSPEAHISNGWFEPHEKRSWHEDDKTIEIEYEPTDEEYAWGLSCVGSWGLTREELKEIGEKKLNKIAAAIIEAYPGIKDLMDKDEEFANALQFNHDLEEFDYDE